jgi:nicotinamide-nucleotide amidase
MRIDDDLYGLLIQVGRAAVWCQWLVATAESPAASSPGAITAVAGSSAWFDRGFVTYSNEAKIEQLGVSLQTLATYGAVSTQTAAAMAAGALRASRAQWAVAVTGVAGPGGGSIEKPVGMVCFGWASLRSVTSEQRQLKGDRNRLVSRPVVAGLVDRLA